MIANTCVAFTIVDLPESYIQAEQHTMVNVAEDRGIALIRGQMLARGGKRGLRVKMSLAQVNLDPQSMVLLESRAGQPEKIMVIDDPTHAGVTVQVDGRSIPLQESQGLILTGRVEQLADDATMAQLPGSTAVSRTRYPTGVMRIAVHTPELVEENVIFQCVTHRIQNYLYKTPKRQQGLVSRPNTLGSLPETVGKPCKGCFKSSATIAEAADAPRAHDMSGVLPVWRKIASLMQGSPKLRPVAFTSPMIQGFRLDPAAQVEVTGPDSYELKRGGVLVNATRPITITNPNCSIECSRNAAFLATTTGRLTRVWHSLAAPAAHA